MKKTIAIIAAALGIGVAGAASAQDIDLKTRMEYQTTMSQDQRTSMSWLNARYSDVNFGVRDTAVFPEQGDETHNVDVGLEARILDPVSIKLIHNVDTGDLNYSPKSKFGIELHPTDGLDLGLLTGSSDTERLVLPYAMLDIKGHKFFVSYSELENADGDISRLNTWAILNMPDSRLITNGSFGAGTAGLDNDDSYVIALRGDNLLSAGYGVQAMVVFDELGAKDIAYFTSNRPYGRVMDGIHIPNFTNAGGRHTIIPELNLFLADPPLSYEFIPESDARSLFFRQVRDQYWFVEGAYMLPEPLSSERARPILFGRYTENTPSGLPGSTAVKFGGSLVVPVSYQNVMGQVQMTAEYNDNLDDNQKPTTTVQAVVNFSR
ncbi:MAG: hypothetical protein KKE20_03200 [Nanoarchaeota archaeon]|nr:hypothetical protein [Nanoarchaeota archaeon]